MTLRAKRPSGLTFSTYVTFHHNSWTPAKADEARAARERREVLIIRGRFSEATFGVHHTSSFMETSNLSPTHHADSRKLQIGTVHNTSYDMIAFQQPGENGMND